MTSWVIPSDAHSVGDGGHTTDHNHVADDLTLIAAAWPGVTTGIPSTTQTIAINRNTTQTTTYSISSSDFMVLCNAAGGGFTVTLPSAAANPGQVVFLKKTDSSAGVILIATTGGQTIDGFASGTYELDAKNWALLLASDGSNWRNMASYGFTDNNILDNGSGAALLSGLVTLGGGTATATSAPVLTPTFASGTAAQLSDLTRDYMVYLQIGTAGTANTVAIGPTSTPANTVVSSGTATAGQLMTIRMPAGWYLKWSATTATLAHQIAIGC